MGVGVGRRRSRLEQLGDRPVQPDPLERDELGEQHLADERVGEPEPAGGAGLLDDEPGRAGLGDLVDELGADDLLDERRGRRSAPATAATRSASLARSDRRDSRRPVASRTPSGSVPGSHVPPDLVDVAQRPR